MPETNHPIFLESLLDLLPFQTEFLKRGLMARGVDTSVLSGPRGLGKSSLAAAMLTSAMTPGTELWIQGAESVLLGSNMEQARICFRFVREWLEAGENPGDYRYQDAATRIGITHKPSGSRLRVISSSGRGAMGLGARTNIAVLDEPGAFHEAGGTLMWNALSGALGKPGSRMRLIAIGTLAPGGVPGSWWGNLVDGWIAAGPVRAVAPVGSGSVGRFRRSAPGKSLNRDQRSVHEEAQDRVGGSETRQPPGRVFQILQVQPTQPRRPDHVANYRRLGPGEGTTRARAEGEANGRRGSRIW